MINELAEIEHRFWLAQIALKDQKQSKSMKLKNDEAFIENCFRVTKVDFDESELEEIRGYVNEFEAAVENNDRSSEDDDSSDP